MIKQKAILKLIDSIESGRSKATGNDWQSRNVVLEFKDLDGYTHTISAKTFKEGIVNKLGELTEGDEVEVGLVYSATCRTWTDKTTGAERVARGNDIMLLSIENVSTF